MRCFVLPLVALVVLLSSASLAVAQERDPEAARREELRERIEQSRGARERPSEGVTTQAVRRPRPSTTDPFGTPAITGSGQVVAVEVTLVDATLDDNLDGQLDGLTDRELADHLGELERNGLLASVNRIRLTTLDQLPATVQFGGQVPLETGRSGLGGRPEQVVYQKQHVGTMLRVTPRVDGESVVLAISFERSQVEKAAPPSDENSEEQPSPPPPGINTLTMQSTVTIAHGKSVIVGGSKSNVGEKTVQTWLLVRATASEAKQGEAEQGEAENQ